MVYYGDEVGLSGDNDPGCRGTMPWDEADWNHDLLAHVREFIRLRGEHPALRRGSQVVESVGEDIAIMRRASAADESVMVAVNRGSKPVELNNLSGRVVHGARVGSSAAIEIPAKAIVVLVGGREGA